MNEMQNRLKQSNTFKEDERSGTKESLRDSVSKLPTLEKSTKKMLKKTKTEKIDTDTKDLGEEGSSKKIKVNYNLKDNDGSDGESDSEPSEDNLDSDQILKLIPKKFGKKKYLKGLDEKKKKPAPVQTEVKVPKKPKTMLMPCMSKKMDKEAKSTRNASESTVKKNLNTFKYISYRLRNVGR